MSETTITGPDLRARREALGLNRGPVAVRAGITVAQLCTIEAGGKREKVIDRVNLVHQALDALQAEGVTGATNNRGGRKKKDDESSPSSDEEGGDTGGPCRLRVWGTFRKDDPVRVKNEDGALVKQKFRFVAFTRDERGHEIVEVFGGTRGHEKMRYFRPERVVPFKQQRRSTKELSLTG